MLPSTSISHESLVFKTYREAAAHRAFSDLGARIYELLKTPSKCRPIQSTTTNFSNDLATIDARCYLHGTSHTGDEEPCLSIINHNISSNIDNLSIWQLCNTDWKLKRTWCVARTRVECTQSKELKDRISIWTTIARCYPYIYEISAHENPVIRYPGYQFMAYSCCHICYENTDVNHIPIGKHAILCNRAQCCGPMYEFVVCARSIWVINQGIIHRDIAFHIKQWLVQWSLAQWRQVEVNLYEQS